MSDQSKTPNSKKVDASNMNFIPSALDQTTFDEISFADWQSLASKSLRDKTLEELTKQSASGIEIEPLYTHRPNALAHSPIDTMQRWDNRFAVIGDNAKSQHTNLHKALQGGIDSLQVSVDSPEKSTPIVIEELHTVLANVELSIIPVSLFAGSQFKNAANKLEAIWSSQNLNADQIIGSYNADPIGTLASTGGLATELNTSIQNMAALAKRTNKTFPLVSSVCVNSVCYHNAGATIEQELVSSIATATLYLQALLDAGLDEQASNNTIVFQVACDADTLTNVVKLRALKELWCHVATHMGVTNPRLKMVAESSARMQSSCSPWINHLRNVSAATAAAMGGAQSILIHPHNQIDDQFIDDQSELSARVARNIAIILNEESAMTFVHDPMAGSYAVETLSTNLVNSCWEALQQLENNGGLISALTAGSWQAGIAASQKTRANRLQQEQDVQVGVNKYKTHTQADEKTQARPTILSAKIKQIDAMPNQVKPLLTVRDAQAFEI